jgi:hypothetical protein
MFDRIAFVVMERIQSKEKDKNADAPNARSRHECAHQEHHRARVLMKCFATLIARADSSELTSESLIKGKLMGVAHRAISIHVGSSVLN